jgi:anti-anti-sigma factor
MADIRKRSRADRRDSQEITPAVERRSPVARDLEVKVEQRTDGCVLIRVGNEFTAQNHFLLDEALERLSPYRPDQRIELEMSQVPYADSEALGRLISWSRKLHQTGARLVVVDPTPYVSTIMEIMKLESILPVIHRHTYPTEED